MAASPRHLRLARPLLALAAASALLAGCGSGVGGISGGGKVVGRTVTVYSILPDPAGAARDEIDGEKLALADAGGRAGGYAVNFSSLDAGDGSDGDAAEASRRAISDPQIIAVLANATPVTVPLFNAAGILQVAPGGDAALASDPRSLPSGRPTVAPLPASGPLPAGFAGPFRTTFARAPTAAAQQGYRAMSGVLQAVAGAGAHGNDRQQVIDRYFAGTKP
jgi:hypothetical protein